MALRTLTPPRRFIAIDREAHTLQLWKRRRFGERLELATTYRVAVGMDDYPTRRGLFVINDRDFHPTWTLPDSDWVVDAGLVPGSVIPYGSPYNPIVGRWLGLQDADGVGIHGTDDVASLGKDASHGCIRMAVPDIEALFPEAPLHTPVYIS